METPAPPPQLSHSHSQRRRSSAATATGTALSTTASANVNVNRWSHSTASTTSPPDHAPHPGSFSRKLSIPAAVALSALHGDAAPPHSAHDPSSLALLPSTVYDPYSPPAASASTSTADSPSPPTAGLFTPSVFAPLQPPHDYFSAKPPPTSNSIANPANRSHSRSRTRDCLPARSPLGSPAIIGAHDPDARHTPIPGAARLPTAARAPTTAPTRETAQRQTSGSAGHRRSASGEHPRSESREPRSDSRGHYRSDSRDLHRRTESNASARLDDVHHGTPPRTRERREKDKKTMLSRALQQANTAVLLDNAQNFEGAMEAYEDACKLLQQVMVRSTQEEDRRKLDAIRVTYTNRIDELRRLDPAYTSSNNNNNNNGKSLPARPMSGASLDEQRSMLLEDDDEEDEPAVIQTATVTRIVNDPSLNGYHPRTEPEPHQPYQLPLRMPEYGGARESVISTAIRDVQRNMQSSQFHLQPPPGRLASNSTPSSLEPPMDQSYMPPPLSPRRSKSPLMSATLEPKDQLRLLQPQQPTQAQHQRAHSNESTSWLDTIDESGGSSCSSSVHSLMMGGVSRKHTRDTSGGTEAEFDAALDAAVEAAYDEGYEPFDAERDSADPLDPRFRNTELDQERAREAEREEIIQAAKYRYKENQLRNDTLPHVRESAELMFNEEAEEEERLLDEMTREYMLDGFDFDLQTKSSLPRQSDSSGFSGSTHNSSISSHRTTGGTSLSTVAEVMHLSNPKSLHSPPRAPAPSSSLPALPPPSGALPSVPEMQTSQELDASEATPRPTTASKESASVRSRRLSGINAKTLKIETSLSQIPAAPHTEKPPVPEKESSLDATLVPKSAAATVFGGTQPTVDNTFKVPALPPASQQAGLAAPTLQPSLYSPAETASPGTPALNMTNEPGLAPGSPIGGRGSTLAVRKNKSSLSLKQRNMSVSSPDGSDVSMGTPLSTSFSITGRKPSIAPGPLPTPSLPTFNVDGLPSGGMHLFESDIHSPFSPGSPSPAVANAPIPLEPCPETHLLRPFWLMRCFYQTIVHPRGGYLSTKLFIPRDVWRVKGVKLKNIEDKVANCDLLTAALQKLASVDTFDADAVLEEMQALEVVLDQVQAQLAKKLGNEVGVQSVATLFKDATTVGEGGSISESLSRSMHSSLDHGAKGAVAQGKSYLSSWRKLRSKNSGVNLASMAGGSKSGEVAKDSLNMATLPMTSLPAVRFAKRDMSGLVFEGPNSGYMSSLAKLFDAVQILDQIARQVEDPGLKLSSPTHVGLELSTRHAAEFFGFYICRFVLSDVTLMLDKFIKRGSEWVLV